MSEATKRNLRPDTLTLIQLDDLETAVINNDFIQKEHLLAAIRMARKQRSVASETAKPIDLAVGGDQRRPRRRTGSHAGSRYARPRQASKRG